MSILRGEDGSFTEEWLRADSTGLSMTIPNSSDLATKTDIENLDKKLEDHSTELKTNINFTENGIEIGRGDFKVNISETELYFSQYGEKIAYISNNKLYITHGQFTESMAIGKDEIIVYEWVVRSNKHLTLRLRKGSGS